MAMEFGTIESAQFVSAFRAFVHDNGMPGVRLEKEDGSYVNVVFSVSGLQELQKQLSLAEQMASSRSHH